MTTYITPPSVFAPVAHQRLLTIADVAALPSELPSGKVRYQLDYGRLVIMPPPGDIHGCSDARVIGELMQQGQIPGHGEARAEVGLILGRNPDRLVTFDAAFITKASLPVRRSQEGYLETIPELVSETRSKNDTIPEIERKVAEYHQAGVRVVWLLDPFTHTITIYRRGQQPVVLQTNDVLTVPDLIPGFQVVVRDLFGA